MKISKDLEWLALNVDRWPSPEVTHIALDPDGEVRFKGAGSLKFDFTPGEPAKGLVSNYAWLKGNPGHTYRAWGRARGQLRTKEHPMDIERLRTDPAYWDEVAPEGAEVYIIDCDPRDDLRMPSEFFYADHDDRTPGRDVWRQCGSRSFWRKDCEDLEVIPRPAQWRGPEDGLPPVGTVCEVRERGPFREWSPCRVLALNESESGMFQVCVRDYNGDMAIFYPGESPVSFRPLKSDKERAVEAALAQDSESRDWMLSRHDFCAPLRRRPSPPAGGTAMSEILGHDVHDDITVREAARRQAHEHHGDDDCEIDEDAEVLFTDEGAWVQAWVWVPREVDDD